MNDNQQPAPRVANNAAKRAAQKVGAFSREMAKEAGRQIAGSGKGRNFPSYQDHGLYCPICKRKRWCRLS